MRKKRLTYVWLGIVCAIGILGFGSAASGAVITLFEDNLDSNTTVNTAAWPGSGDFDPDNATVGTWGVLEPGAAVDVQVSDCNDSNPNVLGGQQPTAHSGSNYVIGGYHFNYYSNWGHVGLPIANLTSDAAKITLDFYVYGTGGTATGGNYKVYVAGYSGFNRAGNGAFLLIVGNNGVLSYRNSGAWVAITTALTQGAWNHVIMDLDLTVPATPVISISVNGSTPEGGTAYYAGDATVGSMAFYSDYTAYFDDIKVTTTSATVALTMQTNPSLVTTVVPAVGTHDYTEGTEATISASRYVSCPDVYVFDHWEGDVANPTSATTTVTMDAPKTVTAVFVDGRVCGDECHAHPASDLDGDCDVDIDDLSLFVATWLDDTNPQ